MEIREFTKLGDHLALPDLVEIQTRSYEQYLQADSPSDRRKKTGLEALLRESFPIESFDGKLKLEYLGYELGKPRYTPDECRKLRLTYGKPFKIYLRLMKDEPVQEWVYLGEIPIMMGGGEFIINGAERVIVSQLHRSPGVDFLIEKGTGDRPLHSCRIIPERGSWIEIDVNKKDVLTVRIDQSGKFPVTALLRAMDEKCATDADLIRLFYKTEKVRLSGASKKTKVEIEDFVAIDFETASSSRNSACSIGLAFVEEGKVVENTSYLLKPPPGTVFNPYCVAVHGITEDDVKKAPTLADIWPQIKKQIGKRTLVAHNAPFDRSVLFASLAAFDIEKPDLTFEDTCQITKKLFPDLEDHCLPTVAEHLGVGLGKHHDAKADAKACAEIMIEIKERAQVRLEPVAGALTRIRGKNVVGDVVNPATGEVLVESGEPIGEQATKALKDAGVDEVEIITEVDDPLMLNTIRDDQSEGHEDALLRIHARLRPGNPAKIDKARALFEEKFSDPNRYRLGRVGRFRLNRKFSQKVDEDVMTLRAEDLINSIQYVIRLRASDPTATVDDIDHLGNRRLRTIDELANDELRKGFLRLRRTVQERMSLKEARELTPRSLINSKTISSAIDFFFGRGELSQVVDQTNPLSQLTNERRLSALGPGGLNRKRASFEVRDVHISHYGRICPIETPEGTNIGLIASLSVYASVDSYGFLITPYRIIKNGRATGEIKWLRADEEENHWMAPADIRVDENGKVVGDIVLARWNGEFMLVDAKKLEFMDISPKQMLGVSASLIPFLEHDDANRALMGSNMQRQAVPLLRPEPPIVATGMERAVAQNSGMVIRAERAGVVKYVDANHIVIGDPNAKPAETESGEKKARVEPRPGHPVLAEGDVQNDLRKFVGLNERTCLNQKPIVAEGQVVKRGQIIADGAATKQGELALGRNVLVAFMIWDGYNFEDAIIISEKLVKDDSFTSIHIEEFEVEIRETKLGREEFTRDIPNVSERALKNLDDEGIVRVGTFVHPGDILVGKVSPKSKSELSPEEKLLHAIFGRAGEDVKNDSLEVPSGVEGVVISTHKFSRKAYLSDEKRREYESEIGAIERECNGRLVELFKELMDALEEINGEKLVHSATKETIAIKRGMTSEEIVLLEETFDIDEVDFASEAKSRKGREVFDRIDERIEAVKDERERRLNFLKRGDELPTGVLEMVKVYVATKRTMSVGDKMAGRHGNKGVIARVVPEEDMPFLADGTPIEIILNPLGVPSRMNVGQILETHLGWAAHILGFQAICPPFDGAKEHEIKELMKKAGLPDDGKTTLYDGRSGDPFMQVVTVGYIYMMKLSHLVDDKVHARATGPYSLITQQPLGGKARFGGQRFGEMEVWALEAYGAAYVLQEMLTVKSDDVEGRTKIYESMVKGENTLDAGTPVSFEVLCNEIKGLGLNMQLEKRSVI